MGHAWHAVSSAVGGPVMREVHDGDTGYSRLCSDGLGGHDRGRSKGLLHGWHGYAKSLGCSVEARVLRHAETRWWWPGVEAVEGVVSWAWHDG